MKPLATRAFVLLIACTAAYLPLTCINDDVADNTAASLVKPGDKLPWFTVTMCNGTLLDSRSLAGRPSVIVLFNTSCPDCRDELPVLQETYESFGTDGRVAFVAISRAQNNASVASYWRDNNLSLPYSAQDDDEVYRLFATSVIPRTYLCDAQLTVRHMYTDYPLPTAAGLANDINCLLNDAPLQ